MLSLLLRPWRLLRKCLQFNRLWKRLRQICPMSPCKLRLEFGLRLIVLISICPSLCNFHIVQHGRERQSQSQEFSHEIKHEINIVTGKHSSNA